MAKERPTSLAVRTTTELAQISKIEQAIEVATDVRTLKNLADAAEAFRVCAKKAGLGHDAACLGWQAKALAVRKGGEMLDDMDRRRPGRPKKELSHDAIISWDEIDMSPQEGHRWQKFAEASTNSKVRSFTSHCRKTGDETGGPAFIRWLQPPPDDLEIPPPPDGKYRCIVVDPPWPMQKIKRDLYPEQGPGHLDYQIMELDEIAALEMPSADDAHLYLWTTHKFLPSAFEIVKGWDFKYECLMTWVKNGGFTPFSWMYTTEHVLFCRRGNLDVLAKGRRLDFAADTTGHSRKPDLFYELVSEVSPGPRIDMFARGKRTGFKLWGAEA